MTEEFFAVHLEFSLSLSFSPPFSVTHLKNGLISLLLWSSIAILFLFKFFDIILSTDVTFVCIIIHFGYWIEPIVRL